MWPEAGESGVRPACSTQGARQARTSSESRSVSSQARALQAPAEILRHAVRPEPPQTAQQRSCRRPAPRLRAEQGEGQVEALFEPAERTAIALTVTARDPLHRRGIVVARAPRHECAVVGQHDGPGPIGVAEFHAQALQIGTERDVRRRGHEQRVPARQHVVNETRFGDLVRANAAAEAMVALEHAHRMTFFRQHGGAHQGVDAAAEDDAVEFRHVIPEHSGSPVAAARRAQATWRRACSSPPPCSSASAASHSAASMAAAPARPRIRASASRTVSKCFSPRAYVSP